MRTTFLSLFLILSVISCGKRKTSTTVIPVATLNNSNLNTNNADQTIVNVDNASLNATSSSSSTSAADIINFGTTPIDTVVTKAIGFTNSGATQATQIVVKLDPGQFTIESSYSTDKCGSTLDAGKTCYVYVSFKPNAATSFFANLTIDYFDGSNSQQIVRKLDGAGSVRLIGVLSINVSANNQVDFESIASGSRKNKSFTLTNTGNGDISGLNIWLPSPEYYRFESPTTSLQCNRVNGILKAGQSCNLELSFGATLAAAVIDDAVITSPLTIKYFDGQSSEVHRLI